MSSQNLFKPVTDQGVLNTNFFEGRLLTGRDLRDQLQAHGEHDRYLGKAIGAGIIEGLEVELDETRDGSNGEPPVVIVKKGLAINGKGDVMGLPLGDIQLSLSRTLEVPQFEEVTFRNCAGIPTGQYVPNGVAVYLLVMSPAAQYKEKALKSGLGDEGIAKGCGSRYIQEGVEFRLVEFPIASLESVSAQIKNELSSDLLSLNNYAKKDEVSRLSRLKNYLATICIGEQQVLAENFSGAPNGRDEIPVLHDPVFSEMVALEDLKTSDVPLSLFYWTPQGITFNDMWSARRMVNQIFPGGVLRLNQFADHLEWLLDKLGTTAVASIDQYFRYIPPAALVPHRIINSARGFRPQDLLEGLHRGGTDRTRVGQINRFLLESFRYPSIDLTAPAYLQLFTQNDLDNLPATVTRQQYFFYASRDLFGAHVDDEIARVVADTWNVYRGLVRRQVFLPPAASENAIAARATITEVFRDVLSVANRYAAIVATSDLDVDATLQAFSKLFDVQSDMAESFLGSIPGIADTQDREMFAQVIQNILLVATPPGSGPSYQSALQNRDLYGALNSQIEINRFVGQWSGEGVAVGPFFFSYMESPEGIALIPGEQAIPHRFTLINATNRSLEFLLSVKIEAESGNWSNRATIQRALGGSEIDRIFVARGESATIYVMTSAPVDAVVGQAVGLELIAQVGSPTNRDYTYRNINMFIVDEERGEPQVGRITASYEFLRDGIVLDSDALTSLGSGDIVVLNMNISHQIPDPDDEGSQIAEVDIAVDIMPEESVTNNWMFLNESADEVEPNSDGVYTTQASGIRGNIPNSVQPFFVIAPSSQSVLNFRIRLRTLGLENPVSLTFPEVISLAVNT